MTLDCTNLKPGDKVRLRNGDIDIVQLNDHIKLQCRLECHYPNGQWLVNRTHEFDIVEILPKQRADCILIKTETTYGTDQPIPPTLPRLSWGYRLGTLELSDFTFRDPAKITINGKQYVPAKDPNLCHPLPYKCAYTVSATTNEVVAITCDGKRFTPADSWPEPITDRLPTKEDANEDGDVQLLDGDGDWMRHQWDDASKPDPVSWARTSDWKPRPIDKKTLTIRDLMEAVRDGKYPDHDTLQSAIELLEATL
jgi:hypothetical protein